MNLNKFIDFDKNDKVVYYNLYLNENNIIVKIPLLFSSEKKKNSNDIKIEEFSLIDYSYKFLVNCEQKLVI